MARKFRRVPRNTTIRDVRQVGDVTVADVSPEPSSEEPPAAPKEVGYRELQAQAKEAGVPANQSREDLEAALSESDA